MARISRNFAQPGFTNALEGGTLAFLRQLEVFIKDITKKFMSCLVDGQTYRGSGYCHWHVNSGLPDQYLVLAIQTPREVAGVKRTSICNTDAWPCDALVVSNRRASRVGGGGVARGRGGGGR